MPLNNDKPARPPTSYRQTRRRNERTLLFLALLVLVAGGAIIIGLIWGVQMALTGSVCLVGGAVLITGLWLLLSLVQKLVEE